MLNDTALLRVVKRAYRSPYTTQSDFARANAAHVAMAASSGLLTTRIGPGTFGKHWRVTTAGLRYLNEKEMD